MSDSEAKKTLQQALKETWMSALGAVSGVEGEMHKATSRVIETLGLPRDEAGKLATGELLARVRRNTEVLEQRVDEGVRSAVHRLRQPIVIELAALRARLEKVQRAVDKLAHRRRPG